jgi:hypothetical protein
MGREQSQICVGMTWTWVRVQRLLPDDRRDGPPASSDAPADDRLSHPVPAKTLPIRCAYLYPPLHNLPAPNIKRW